MTGKIIKGIAGFYYIHNGQDKVYACKAKGIFRNRGIKPVVGDNVKFTVLDEEALEGNIDEILPRTNVLVRPASANVDQALVVFAITQPDPNFNLLDRFLIMMLAQDIPVTICFNKTDLETVISEELLQEKTGKTVISISAKEETGIDKLEKTIQNLFYEGSIDFNDEVLITNVRHKTALQNALNSLYMVKQSIENQMPEDFLTIDLMDAYEKLGRITGEAVDDDLADEIFAKFCMGK